jgi:hypothetical protein
LPDEAVSAFGGHAGACLDHRRQLSAKGRKQPSLLRVLERTEMNRSTQKLHEIGESIWLDIVDAEGIADE